jgi:hypothetical protein
VRQETAAVDQTVLFVRNIMGIIEKTQSRGLAPRD